MRRWLYLLALAMMLSACSGKREVTANAVGEMAEARVDRQRAAWVAYAHEVELEVAAARMRQVFEAIQQACAALPERGCTLLEASIRGGAAAGASVRMRVTPDGVNKVLRSMDGQGKVVSRSSKGEDLAEPIQDADRKMIMLTAYRDHARTRDGGTEP